MSALQLDARGVLIACSSCGKVNRLRYEVLDRQGRCAHCRNLLGPPAAPIETPSAPVFDALVATASAPLVVDFWAPWCGPCHVMAPELEKVARDVSGEVLIVKVNTDALPELGERFRIRSIPTMAVFRSGRELTRTAGARPAADILSFVRQTLLQPAS